MAAWYARAQTGVTPVHLLMLGYFTGQWENHTYVMKIAAYGWLFHYCEERWAFEWVQGEPLLIPPNTVPFLVMGRVTYLHHYVSLSTSNAAPRASLTLRPAQLPTLWFAVLMAGHMLDTFLFNSPRLSRTTKALAFWLLGGSVVACFWWFRGVAWGIDGAIEKTWGLGWRKSWNVSVRSGAKRFRGAHCSHLDLRRRPITIAMTTALPLQAKQN